MDSCFRVKEVKLNTMVILDSFVKVIGTAIIVLVVSMFLYIGYLIW